MTTEEMIQTTDQELNGYRCSICNEEGKGSFSLYGVDIDGSNGHGCGVTLNPMAFTVLTVFLK
jgi:hypothetical protein